MGNQTAVKKRDGRLKSTVKKFMRHKLAMISTVLLLLEILLVIFLPIIMKLDPYTSNVLFFGAKPSGEFLLGCDDVGRDLLARLIYGGRTSLGVGFCSVIISTIIGVPMGVLAGYYKGVLEVIMMRLTDILLSVPSMVLILVMVAVSGPSIVSVTIIIGVMGSPGFARMMYSSVLSVSQKDYIERARAIGTPNIVIMWRDVFLNAFTPILVSFTFSLASSILMESSLSFLGMGVQAPKASWGNMLYAAQSISVISQRPWMWVPPGLCLLITVLSINFIGDGLRDALDPKMKV